MSSTTSSSISLVKTIIGAGMLSMPLAFATDGLVLGCVWVVVAAVTAGFGLFIQAYVSRYVPKGHASFFNVCSITYPALSVVFDIAIAVQCFGCSLSYLVLIGDIMPTVVAGTSRTLWICVSAAVIVPLSFLKNLDSLKFTSVLGLVALFYLVVVILGHYFVGDVPREGAVAVWPPTVAGMFTTFSIIVFAFTGHQNMFSIINEARDKSMQSLGWLIHFATITSAVLFIAVGLAGYLTFGDQVDGNIILSYPQAASTTVARFAIVLMVTFSFPLMFHPARISVNNIYYWLTRTDEPESGPEDEQAPLVAGRKAHVVPFPTPVFMVITSVLLAVAYVLAVSIKSFALVLAVVGATGSTAISFILPGLFGWKLFESSAGRAASMALVVWGFAVMVVCLYSTLAGAAA
ncbi:vacuolar amino acid transporter 6 [Diutina catenulata]